MKKTLLRLLFAFLLLSGYSQANAQCIPANNLIQTGFHTSSGDTVICIPVGNLINEIVQIKIADTIAGLPIEYFIFDSISNLPNGVTYSFDTTIYPAKSTGCFTLIGQTNKIGYYDLKFYVSLKATGLPVVKGDIRQLSHQFGTTPFFALNLSIPQSASLCNLKTTGKVFYDNGGNCSLDSTDLPYANSTLLIDNQKSISTNSDGNYIVRGLEHGPHMLLLPSHGEINFPCQGTNSISFFVDTNIQNNTINFPVERNMNFKDLSISYRPFGFWLFGYNARAKITVRNNAYTAEDAIIKLDYDTAIILTNSDSVPTANDTVNHHAEWNITSIPAHSQVTFEITFRLPLPTANNVIDNSFTVLPIIGDYDSTNNVIVPGDFVFGSFDPNDISVSPKGEGIDGKIRLSDSVLNYTIRFQNTGTGPAVNIYVLDTLDSDLNPLTFKAEMASHNYSTTIMDNRVVRFDFNNIMLPDSNSNEKDSHGFVQYRINKKTPLGYGTVVTNSASIYFDFNSPVLTNTATSTYYNFVSGLSEAPNEANFLLFPNPASETVNVALANEQKRVVIKVLDITGRTMLTEVMNNSNTLAVNIQNLSKGVYVVAIDFQKVRFSKRLIIE